MKKKVVDPIDIQIINRLQQNAAVTNKDLAEQIGLSPGPTLVRVQKLWSNQILKTYRAEVNLAFFGYQLYNVATITISGNSEDEFLKRVNAMKYVLQCAKFKAKFAVINSRRFLLHFLNRSEEEFNEALNELVKGLDILDLETTELGSICKNSLLILDENDNL